jgi:D-alanine-D-alanine ligase
MTLGIVFGSKSFEHEISIVSSIAMKKILKNKLEYIFIDQNRDIYHIPTDIIKSKLFSSGEYKKCTKLQIAKGGFFKSSLFGQKKLKIDTILNLTHGADGEDGILASMFNFFDIPFIGPRVEACSVSCNKFLTKMYANELDVKTIDFKHYNQGDEVKIDKYPVIIKPSRLGSSIGVSIVKSEAELEYALDVAFEFDNDIIIEPFIDGIKEYNLAGTKINEDFIFSIVEEPQKEEFLDFEKKYMDFNRTEQVLKANIDDNLITKLQDNFKILYNNTFEGSLIRCDFFVVDNEVYLNEINTIPGSMANYLFDDFNQVINNLANNLPKQIDIKIDYTYVNKIQSAKGK